MCLEGLAYIFVGLTKANLPLANFDEIKQHQSADFCDYIHGFDQARLPLSSKRSFVLGYLFSTLSLMVVYSNLCSSHVVPTRNEDGLWEHIDHRASIACK